MIAVGDCGSAVRTKFSFGDGTAAWLLIKFTETQHSHRKHETHKQD